MKISLQQLAHGLGPNAECRAPNAHKGLTLIELLVVVTILSVLGMVGLNIFSGNRQVSADQTRLQQINTLKQALELYRNQFHSYPQTLAEVTPIYLDSIPADPQGRQYQYLALPSSACTSAAFDCNNYVICAKKEGNRSFATPSECSSLSCAGTVGDCDLGVKE